jgi:glycosyl transferase family 87
VSPSVIERLTSPARLRLMAGVFGALLLAAFVMRHATAERMVEPDGAVIGRDFLAFYTAGQIVRMGRGAELYGFGLQTRLQARLIAPEKPQGTAYFTNPAPVAAAYSLLARLPYLPAFYLHTALMAVLVFLGVWTLRGHLPALGRHWKVAALLGLLWLPMMNAVTGGQNSALAFALMAVAYAAWCDNRPGAAGVALGLLLFKPQFALPLIGLMALRREIRLLASAGATGLMGYLVGALACGWTWPGRMVDALRFFHDQEGLANGPWLISLTEAWDYSVIRAMPGIAGTGLALALTFIPWIIALTLLAFLGYWWHTRAAENGWPIAWALAVAITLLVSPHTQHYDVALLLLPVLLLLDRTQSGGASPTPMLRLVLLLGFFVYPIALWAAPTLHVQALVLLPAAVAWWAISLSPPALPPLASPSAPPESPSTATRAR